MSQESSPETLTGEIEAMVRRFLMVLKMNFRT